MLAKITILTSYLFAILYPLCFWISWKDPLKNNFHRFHLGLPSVVAGVILFFVATSQLLSSIKIITLVWCISLLLVSICFWRKEYPSVFVVTVSCIIGFIGYVLLLSSLVASHVTLILSSLIGGLIFCSVLFAMNLGHWYLNVHGLPIKHLKNATVAFIIFLSMRLIWDVVMLVGGNVFYNGEYISISRFMMTMEGFLLMIGIVFGTILPLAGTYCVMETIKLKNTQSSTGILYVLLCSVLIGDITYKYFAIKYGVYL